MNTEIEVNSHVYLIGKLDVFKQFHVARRLAPVLAALGSSAGDVAKAETADGAMMGVLSGVASVVAQMPEDDVNYVLNACLSAARRKSDDKWARVMTGTNLMFADMQMDEMMRITIETIKENLGSFFPMAVGGRQ